MPMLKLLVEETVMSNSDMTPGHIVVTFGNEDTGTGTDGDKPSSSETDLRINHPAGTADKPHFGKQHTKTQNHGE